MFEQLREAVFHKTLFMRLQTWILYNLQVSQSIAPPFAYQDVITVLSLLITQNWLILAHPVVYSSFPQNIVDLIQLL